VTINDVIYQRRAAAVAHATQIGNITQAAATFGIARQTLSGWIGLARRRGLSALLPKSRRPGTQPNAMADWEVEIILAEAIARPTLGAGRLLEHLAERDVHRSRTGVQKVLHRHGLGTRALRVGALATLTTATTGQVTRDTDPSGFCLWAAQAGDLVGLDAFYVGRLKGIGPVWQLTACDTRTRWTIAELIVGRPNSAVTATFLDLLIDRLEKIGVVLSGVIVDGGPEWKAGFRRRAELRGIAVHQTPPRSPNHNGICERVQGTLLEEFYRPTFHRAVVADIPLLNRQLQAHLERHNTRRRNHGNWMAGRTPLQVLTSDQQRAEPSPQPVACTV
jgi:transposase